MDFLEKIGLDLDKASTVIATVGWLTLIKIAAEIFIVVYALIWIWVRIRGTQAERLLKGVLVLTLICILSALAGFTLITSILQQLIPVAVLALLIIFQPELRRGLGYLGRSTAFKIDFSLANSEKVRSRFVVDQIIIAVRELARTKTGALLVVEPLEGERDYLSPGIPVNADVSSSLFLSIFFPNSPLHDGAVIVRGDKIVAAGVLLRMTDNPNLSYKYGTRHRAAIGLSEIYDGLCIVVSEETGVISAASHGMLVKYQSADELADPLSYIYHTPGSIKSSGPLHSFLTLFSRGRRREPDTATGGASERSDDASAQPQETKQPVEPQSLSADKEPEPSV
jgi:diadenylate cyclase